MTPAINLLIKTNTPHTVHEYVHEKSAASYGLEAAEKMDAATTQIFKTLVVMLDNQTLAVCIIPVSSLLNMKRIANAFGVKKVTMANKADVERSTGYVLGGVSPLGQKKRLKTMIDSSAAQHSIIYVSGGRRGLEIALSTHDLKTLTQGEIGQLCQ